jgi:L-methionine (R)-S-oxide reductase
MMVGWGMDRFPEVYPSGKADMYRLLCSQLAALCAEERHPVPNMANASALLAGALERINWTGFYIVREVQSGQSELMLGPFQGKTACIRIPAGKGVCGTALAEDKTQLVPDVHAFAGHIACDSASQAEIVVPIHALSDGHVAAVLDIDSPELSRFDGGDQEGLEHFARVLEKNCDWQCFQGNTADICTIH